MVQRMGGCTSRKKLSRDQDFVDMWEEFMFKRMLNKKGSEFLFD